MTPESKEELTKKVALQLQIALTAWNELYPDDTDEDACRKSLDLIEFEVEDLLTRPDTSPAPNAAPEAPSEESADDDDDEAEVKAMTSRVGKRTTRSTGVPFRQILMEIGREYPGGFDITKIVEEAQARGWSHPNARNFVSITASQLVRGGLLVRPGRGTYALSPAFAGATVPEDGDDP